MVIYFGTGLRDRLSVNVYVYPTDHDWFNFLSSRRGIDDRAFELRTCLARRVVGAPALAFDTDCSQPLIDRSLPCLAGI